MHIFYVSVPSDYKYDWSVSSSPTEVLRIKTGTLIEFVCNSHARLSEGDVYQVGVDSEKDELFFSTQDRIFKNENRSSTRVS